MQAGGLRGEQRGHGEINAGAGHVEAVAGGDDEGDDPARHAELFHALHGQGQGGFRRSGGKAQGGGLGDGGGKTADGDAREEQNGREHQQKNAERDVAGDEQFAERQQRGQAHAADGVGQGRARGDGRHDHDDFRQAEHGLRQRLQHADERRAFGLGQRGQRGAEEQREDGYLQNLVFGDGLGDVLRKDVEQNLLPAFAGCAMGATACTQRAA